MNEPFDPLGSEFVEVNRVLQPKSAAKKNPASGNLNPSGRFPLNIDGTGLVDGVARSAGLPGTHYWTKFRVNLANKTVAIVAVDADTEGAVEVRRSPDNKTATLYLHGVFAEYPELRPAGDCEVKVTLHPSGKAALINLASGGLGIRHTKRTSTSNGTSSGTDTKGTSDSSGGNTKA